VTVGEIAAGAGVTTGPLYHHFGSKLGLYAFVRDEAERRLLDRMEGAAAARADEGRDAALGPCSSGSTSRSLKGSCDCSVIPTPLATSTRWQTCSATSADLPSQRSG
jgi:hypothetical protein